MKNTSGCVKQNRMTLLHFNIYDVLKLSCATMEHLQCLDVKEGHSGLRIRKIHVLEHMFLGMRNLSQTRKMYYTLMLAVIHEQLLYAKPEHIDARVYGVTISQIVYELNIATACLQETNR